MEASKQKPLSDNDMESELSYAYLHAVASRAGMSCIPVPRIPDNRGVDAKITAYGPFPTQKRYTRLSVDIDIQLKATRQELPETEDHFSYFLNDLACYNDLRAINLGRHHILIVLLLTGEQSQWLNITAEELILRKSAYWVSLYGAEESQNDSGVTIYLPKTNLLTVESLQCLASDCANKPFNLPIYVNPKK